MNIFSKTVKKSLLLSFVLLAISAAYFAHTVYAIPGVANSVSPCGVCSSSSDCIGGGSFACMGGICNDVSGGNTCAGRNTPIVAYSPSTPYERWQLQNGGGASAAINMWSCAVGGCGAGYLGGNGGGLATTFQYMAGLYIQKPASTAESIAELKRNMGIPTAYAQSSGGTGFLATSPILNLWRLSRNIALAGFVVIFIIIGIMIMLRSKIDPRTVITIQQALPSMVISLILVIFSYAIIGLLIDATTVLTRLGAGVLQSQGYLAIPGSGSVSGGVALDKPALMDRLLKANVFKLFEPLRNVDLLIGQLSNLETDFNTVASILQFDASKGGGLTKAVLWIAIFIALLRTFFMLLTSYLSVVVSIIVTPFQFLFYAIPGQGGGYGGWFRSLISHLLVFPTVFFMLAFAAIFSAQANNHLSNTAPVDQNVWQVGRETISPEAPFWAPPGLGDWGGTVGPLLTLAILLTAPKAIGIVREGVDPKHRPGAAEGAAAEGIQKGAARIPILGSFTKA